MTIAPGVLSRLHRIHRQLADLRERLARGPRQVAAAEAVVKATDAAIATAKDNYKKARMTCDEKQLQLKQREARIKDLRLKLNMADSNQTYQAFKEQIAADEKANSVQEDEVLEALELLERLSAEIKTAESNAVKAKEELAKVRQRVSEQTGLIEADKSRVEAQLADAETRLPEDFALEFSRVTKARGDLAMAAVENESCGGCFQRLTAQTCADIILGKLYFCRNCGCLLYPADEEE